MNREEAIKELKSIRIDLITAETSEWMSEKEKRYVDACNMAIEALEQESCDKCEVGNPCLYCKHEFEPRESEEGDIIKVYHERKN